MPKLALLDGHSLAYRAFYALPPELATKSGQVTNAAYGFTSMLIKLMSEEHPEAIAVAWDVGGGTFREESFAEYKAQRQQAPDLFRSQLPLIDEVVETLGIHQFRLPGYEADDVIATLACRAAEQGWEVLVVTGDRDTFQLVDDRIKVIYTRRGISDTVLADRAWIEERYLIRPDQYPDYAALRGDTSDNLPGVPGVGEKTAARLVGDYQHLEGIYQHLDELTPKLRASLEECREQVFLNRRLMRLVRDVAIEDLPGDLRRAPADPEQVRELFRSLEFRTLVDRLGEALEEELGPQVHEVLEVETVQASTLDLSEGSEELLALAPAWEGEHLRGLAVVTGTEEARYVPLDGPADRQWGDVLADASVPKALHDAKQVVRAQLERGGDLRGLAFDTALAGYLISPADRLYELPELAARYLGLELASADRPPEEDEGQGTLVFEGGPDPDAAGRRAVAIARLVDPLREALEARQAVQLLEEVELPLVRVLARMERAGIGVDRGYLEELGESLRDRLATLERRIHEAAGEPFNINSSHQLREVLFVRLGLPALKKTQKGVASTDASVLAKLVDVHPIIDHLLRYREAEKLRSTYVDALLPLIREDGRIHARFNQMVATTGRLSAESPNLQNIPVRSEEGRSIRRAFVARPGWSFIVADYSQIELRVLAHLSEDPELVEAFSGAETDIHTATAARVFAVEGAHITPEMRRRAKVINFGLLYGMEVYGLAQRLEISSEEAKEHIEAYFTQFPHVRAFMENVVAEAKEKGYTTTIFGRRRYLPELASHNYRIRQMGERMALNAPVQGSAADIIKKAMVSLDAELESRGLATSLLLQVHDELVLEAPPDELESATKLTREVMEGVVGLRVPLKVDMGTGANLAECKG
ncbi:MAG: DNA polymerase I [Actinomycetota bacterium]|nr:DNA polymerase I [Actinomycetota bacterium]